MSEPTHIHTLRLEGFRAFLNPVDFDFSSKRCLAVFAPNGKGKSSIIDALEFVFSDDGSLTRLGKRAAGNYAGFVALAHNLAETNNIEPSVTLTTVSGKTCKKGVREAVGTSRKIPDAAQDLKSLFVVSPIIRGYTLRSFVENHTPEERYADVAEWLQLAPLVNVQKNIRALRTQLSAVASDLGPRNRIEQQLAAEMSLKVDDLNPGNILRYVNRVVIAPLDETLIFDGITKRCTGYKELVVRVSNEESKLGVAGLRQIRNAVLAVWEENESTEFNIVKGAIPEFIRAVSRLAAARCLESTERQKAANTVFDAVWNAAAPLFAKDVQFPDKCPVCATPLSKTATGSGVAIGEHIQKHLSELSSYSKAKREYDDAKMQVGQLHARLKAALPVLAGLLRDEDGEIKVAVAEFQSKISDWVDQDLELPESLGELLKKLLNIVENDIRKIESKQGEHTFAKAKVKIDRIFALILERQLSLRTESELKKLNQELADQSRYVSTQIRVKVQHLLDMIQTPMNEIFKAIQGDMAKPVRLELPSEEDTNQQRLNLVIDFAENRKSVQPSGYLSDSQIHSIALALRLASIKVFNNDAPIIALDDIVTSYDADHRRTIAGLIAGYFDKYQIIITTHDERFFSFLKDQMRLSDWHFLQIFGIDPQHGPRINEHKITDEIIEMRWRQGFSAANEIRQAEEEWLLDLARGFGVSVRIRSVEKAHSYERSELASAVAAWLKKARLSPTQIPGVNNRFLDSLIKGVIENFGSHFQDAAYGNGSIGDEQTRWGEFKAFKSQFECKHCHRTRFKRPTDLSKPICAHSSCEKQFEF